MKQSTVEITFLWHKHDLTWRDTTVMWRGMSETWLVYQWSYPGYVSDMSRSRQVTVLSHHFCVTETPFLLYNLFYIFLYCILKIPLKIGLLIFHPKKGDSLSIHPYHFHIAIHPLWRWFILEVWMKVRQKDFSQTVWCIFSSQKSILKKLVLLL